VNAFAMVLKNDLRRMGSHGLRLALYIFMSVVAIAAAVFMSSLAKTAGNIAVVSSPVAKPPYAELSPDVSSSVELTPVGIPYAGLPLFAQIDTDYLNITELQAIPPLSDLVSGRYDAVLCLNENGELKIATIKGDAYREMIASIVSDPGSFDIGQLETRKPGTNICGFLMMFVLMQGITMTLLFGEDIEHQQIKRVVASPVSLVGYVGAHACFGFLFLLIPVMVILAVADLVFAVNIGLSLTKYLFIMTLLSCLASCLAMLLVSVIRSFESTSMVGSSVVILTSVLAGSFFPTTQSCSVFDTVLQALPQKALLSLADALEQNQAIGQWGGWALYLCVLTLVFLVATVLKVRHDYIRG